MIFNSFEFLLFFPIVFLLYWLLFSKTAKLQNSYILIASIFFYGWWDWKFLCLLILTCISTYTAGVFFLRDSKNIFWKKPVKWWMSFLCIILNLGILAFFKYFNFFIESFTDLCHFLGITTNASTLNIVLPVGISFYTFTAISYIVDTYTGKIQPTRDLVVCSVYICFFPAILSGPISKATQQLPQYLAKRPFNYSLLTSGLKMILWGTFMKLCIADRLGIYVDCVYANIAQRNGTTLLFASVLYTLQIYADFAGYSLMAIGCGKMLGINLQTNFIRPYFSKTITEFWSKWHISLTSWFKNYVYFPLGGNRVSKNRWIMNIIIVFLLSGLWHGAAYTFIIWGCMHGIVQIVEKLIYGDKIKQISQRITIPNVLRVLFTFSIVSTAWIFFRADNVEDALVIIRKIFTNHGRPFVDYNSIAYGFFALFILLVKDFSEEFNYNRLLFFNNKHTIIRYAAYLALVFIILLTGTLDAGLFIYFQF